MRGRCRELSVAVHARRRNRPADDSAAIESECHSRWIVPRAGPGCGDTGRYRGSSQRHDNGFDKIVLYRSPRTDIKLVLHLWDNRDGAAAQDNIHNHRWDFASVVLLGCLRSELYQVDPDGQPYASAHYGSPGGGATYEFRTGTQIRASKHASIDLAPGSFYTWQNTVLHRAYGVGPGPVATMIVQSAPLRAHTTVLLRSERPTSDETSVRRLTSARVAEDLEVLMARATEEAWVERRP